MFTSGSSSTPSNKGKEIMVEDDVIVVSSDDEEETLEWLHPLLRTKFWDQCEEHWEKTRGETSLFCLRCYEVLCPHCIHDKPGHHLLKVRRYAYRSVIHVEDMEDLKVSVSRIQKYIVNRHMGLHLRPVKRSPQFRPQPGAPRCLTCRCWLRSTPYIFCSLTCKEKINVSLDEFSASEADRRLRNQEIESFVVDLSSWQCLASQQPFDESALAILAEACSLLRLEQSDAPPVADEHRNTPEADAEQSYKQVEEAVVPEWTSHQCPPSRMQLDDAPPPAPVVELHHPEDNGPVERKRPRKQAKPQRAPFF